MNLKKWVMILVAVMAAVFLLLQVVPYGRAHVNPPVKMEPNWANPQTRELARRACFDCHSNETVWPWYSNIAPVSWLVQRDVDEGRASLNFSEWGNAEEFEESEEMAEVILEGEMPPAQYLITHPEARLTPVEQQLLADGLVITVGASSNSLSDENENGVNSAPGYFEEDEGEENGDHDD